MLLIYESLLEVVGERQHVISAGYKSDDRVYLELPVNMSFLSK